MSLFIKEFIHELFQAGEDAIGVEHEVKTGIKPTSMPHGQSGWLSAASILRIWQRTSSVVISGAKIYFSGINSN